jgi:hypothetical protein
MSNLAGDSAEPPAKVQRTQDAEDVASRASAVDLDDSLKICVQNLSRASEKDLVALLKGCDVSYLKIKKVPHQSYAILYFADMDQRRDAEIKLRDKSIRGRKLRLCEVFPRNVVASSATKFDRQNAPNGQDIRSAPPPKAKL